MATTNITTTARAITSTRQVIDAKSQAIIDLNKALDLDNHDVIKIKEHAQEIMKMCEIYMDINKTVQVTK